jgi:hypothetical protein
MKSRHGGQPAGCILSPCVLSSEPRSATEVLISVRGTAGFHVLSPETKVMWRVWAWKLASLYSALRERADITSCERATDGLGHLQVPLLVPQRICKRGHAQVPGLHRHDLLEVRLAPARMNRSSRRFMLDLRGDYGCRLATPIATTSLGHTSLLVSAQILSVPTSAMLAATDPTVFMGSPPYFTHRVTEQSVGRIRAMQDWFFFCCCA